MRPPTLFALCLSLLLVTPQARAAYQVEVVVFAHVAADSDGEQWVDEAGLPDQGGAALLATGAEAGGITVTPLPATSQHLGGVVAALRKGGRYRTLFHSSWMHPEGGRVRGVFISRPAAGSAPGAAAEILGNVRLRVTRFLHADVDLAYFAPTLATVGAAATHVRLQESRKIRLNEVHYFDHPLFGVLLQVSRVGGADEEGVETVNAAGAADAPQQ